MTSSDWATQQLAEFLAVLTTAADEHFAVTNALERLAESFDADGGAFVRGRYVMSSRSSPNAWCTRLRSSHQPE
jgi:hypothetical protein